MMSKYWQKLSEKTAKLAMREKVIVFSGGILLIGWLAFFYVIDPLIQDINKAEQTISSQTLEIKTMSQQIALYQGALGKDPNAAVNESIKNTEASIVEVDKTLTQLTANFISPDKMRQVLNDLLRSDENVKVTEFAAVPSEKVNIEGVPANADITIYQHGLKLTVKGSYFDLQRYTKRIESLQWRFYWKTFAYTVETYPNAKLEIEISTISTNERFIAI